MLEKLGLLGTPIDGFCNGFLIASLMWIAVLTWGVYILIIPMLDNCIWWPK